MFMQHSPWTEETHQVPTRCHWGNTVHTAGSTTQSALKTLIPGASPLQSRPSSRASASTELEAWHVSGSLLPGPASEGAPWNEEARRPQLLPPVGADGGRSGCQPARLDRGPATALASGPNGLRLLPRHPPLHRGKWKVPSPRAPASEAWYCLEEGEQRTNTARQRRGELISS